MNSTDGNTRPGRRPRRVTFAAAAAALAALAGCSSSPAASSGSGPTAISSVSATVSAEPITPAGSPDATPTPVAVVSSAAAAVVPTLGRPAGLFANGKGFGQVRPAEVFNGGDPTGLVTGISWQSWGGPTATGTGTGTYDPPGVPVAAAKPQPATIVAFNLGTCDGKVMYQAVEWYFPQHGQKFSASQYEDVCTGSYVPNP